MPLLVAASAVASELITDGRGYHNLESPQSTSSPGKVEVLELFWYGCPHCYQLEPVLDRWLKNRPEDVSFVRMPAILGGGWELLAKAYYTAELMGVLDKTHSVLFAEIHDRNNRIKDEKTLRQFFVSQGVLPETFDKTFNSFAVTVKVNNARAMTRRYALSGVPTIIVNGKYSTSAGEAGSNEKVISVINQLIAQERKLLAATPAVQEPAR
jgi:thiol:disulfide interchange protein DsbA